MKRKMLDQTLNERMTGISRSYQVKRKIHGFKDDEEIIAALANFTQKLTGSDSLSEIMQLIRFYHKYKNNMLIEDYMCSLNLALNEKYDANYKTLTGCSYEEFSFLLEAPIFQEKAFILALATIGKQLPTNIKAMLIFRETNSLSPKYFNFILSMKEFHARDAENFTRLIAVLVYSKVEFEKDDIEVISKIKNVLLNALKNDPAKHQHCGTRIIHGVGNHMPGMINKLIDHNMLIPEILNYLYASHVLFRSHSINIFEMHSRQLIENEIRISLLDAKMTALIEINKEYPLKNNPYLLRLINNSAGLTWNKKSILLIPDSVSRQVNSLLTDYKSILAGQIFLFGVLSGESTLAVLPLDVLMLIFTTYCQIHENSQSTKKIPACAFFSAKFVCTDVKETPDSLVHYRSNP